MPSLADPVRSRGDAAAPEAAPPLTEPREALKRPLAELERYSGWLGKDHVSMVVRADVHALGAAIAAVHDAALTLLALDKDIGRLPSGDLRKMLRRALGEIRVVLGPSQGAIGGGETL